MKLNETVEIGMQKKKVKKVKKRESLVLLDGDIFMNIHC